MKPREAFLFYLMSKETTTIGKTKSTTEHHLLSTDPTDREMAAPFCGNICLP